ncbi:MAG: DUF4010 domain-containing protein [Polyangiales bacterium]
MEPIFLRLAVALGLGLLVGVQRERAENPLAGIRTFPLITILGCLLADLSIRLDTTWIFALGLGSLAGLLATGYAITVRMGTHTPGLTTEVAALYMYIIGALVAIGAVTEGVVMGALCALLLHLKEPMEGFADRLSQADVKSVMQFAAIALVVLPVLPNRTYGPYSVLNPFEIWLMVVLIVGISLVGYVLYKSLGARAGTLLGGVLGGLISSTAATASYARRAKHQPNLAPQVALLVMVASTVAYARILVEVAVAAPSVLSALAPPLLIISLANAMICGVALLFVRADAADLAKQDNPSELRAALVFGGLYGLIIFVIAAARESYGDLGLYVIAFISGLTDVDAITLSTANLVEAGRVDPDSGWRAIVLASLSNLAFKGALGSVLGGRALMRRLAPLFLVSVSAGVTVLLLWP